MRELYVWYRVGDDRAGAARTAVRAMQRALAASQPGLQTRLLVRNDGAGAQTWMETYAFSADVARGHAGVDASVEATIATAAQALGASIDGTRHVEAFDDADPAD